MSNALILMDEPAQTLRVAATAKAGLPRARYRFRFGFFATASFRLALIYAVIFGASSVILSVTLWRSTSDLLDQRTQAVIRAHEKSFAHIYTTGGIFGLARSIKKTLKDASGQHDLFLLVDPRGNRIAGNLHEWPIQIGQARRWYHLAIKRGIHRTEAFYQFFNLPGGYRLLVGHDTRTSDRLLKVLQNGMLPLVLEMVALGLIGASMVRVSVKRSIADLSGVVASVAQGDLSKRVRQRSNGYEFDIIGDAVNEMLDEIIRLMDSVRSASNSIAHDLRTPITRVRIRLEDAAMNAHDVPALQEALALATDDLDRVTAIFNAMLRIAEVESGTRRSAFREFGIFATLSDLTEMYEVAAEDRGVTLASDFAGAPVIKGDDLMIQQAVANLLSNAIKFCPPGSTVKLSVKTTAEAVRIAVQDEGPGIPEEDRNRAIERFYRAEAARSTPGSGLGLALVTAVCSLHGGSLLLEDNNPGLKATIVLPRHQ